MNSKCTLSILPLLATLSMPTLAQASGLGNLTYTDQEVFKPVANFGGEGASKWPSGPTGANTAVMIHQKMVVMGSNDSGKPPGSLHIYDVTNPRKPVLQKTLDGTPETAKLRELHAMPVAMPDGRTLLVLPTVNGIQFFDFTDPLNPKPAGTFALNGANGGDYDNTVWMLSWEWPYVFAGGTGNGIFVVDATDPEKCSLVTRITTGSIGNFRIGPTFAAGNFLIGANMDDKAGTQYAVIDIGNPKTPFLAATGKTPASLYSSLVVGDRIYGAGTNGDYVMLKWSDSAVSVVATGKSGKDRGGYCTYESGFAVCGQSSEGFKKWDMSNDKFTFVGTGTDPNGPGGDFDFATMMGNLVFLGNDHGSGSALIPHQTGPDMVAPAVLKVYPSVAKQPLTTRVTIFFSEDLDLDTVVPANIIVRSVGGAVVPGVFSKSSFNAISFGPKAPLTANTTYEVVVPAGGVADLVGNKNTAASTTRFSTGATIDMTGGGGTGAGGAAGQAGAAGSAATGGAGGSGGSGGALAAGGASSTAGGASPSSANGGTLNSTGGGSAGQAVSATAGTGPASGGGAGATASGSPPASTTDDGGCSISLPSRPLPTSGWALGMAGLTIGLGRVRRRNRSPGKRRA